MEINFFGRFYATWAVKIAQTPALKASDATYSFSV
jgi:hypothetical protein